MRNIFTPFFLLFFINAIAQQDGTLDATWTNGGEVLNPIPGSSPLAGTMQQKLIILPSGKFLQTFTRNNGTDNDFGLARLNADGSFDLSFGGSGTGYVITDFGGDDYANTMALQSDGKIVVVGYSTQAGNNQFALARYNTDGTLDPTFGSSGKRLSALGNDDAAYAVAIRPDNKILVGGTSFNGFVYRYTIAQYTANGNLDAGNFNGGNGFRADNLGNTVSRLNAIVLKPDGTIITAGYTTDLSDFDFVVTQYTPSGALDGTFGGGSGFVITDFGNLRDDAAYDVVVTPTGRIIAGGYTDKGSGITPDNDFALAAYTAQGVLDPTFGAGGLVSTDFGAQETAYSMTLQADSRLIVLGSGNTGVADNNFEIARYLSNGSLDPTFGGSGNGKNTINFGSDDRGLAVALGSNYIMTSGISGNTNLALARLINADVALPVTLSSFTAIRENNSVLLKWQTLNEQDAVAFEVERSADGSHFAKIGTVQASRNSQTSHDYSITDAQPLSSVNYYRLRVVNANGSKQNSGIVIVRFGSKFVLQVFPNPVHETLFFQLNGNSGNKNIVISDVSGRMVRSIQIHSAANSISTSIDISSWQNGIYYIRLNDETVKIIKQ